MPYSSVDDLLLGDLPLGSKVDANRFVCDAADEIDSAIGFIYQTPVDTTNLPRHVGLLLKRINNHLASGRLILAIAAGGEDSTLQAYGVSLIKGACDLIYGIVTGAVILTDAPLTDSDLADGRGPSIFNEDENSGVELFYDYFMNPAIWNTRPLWVPGNL